MTIQSVQDITMPASRWCLKDTVWMFGVYGATVGAGTLFLPVEIGTRGPLVFIMLLLLAFPLSMVPHVLICRVFMRDHQTADKSLPMFGTFFGAKGKKAIRVYFCLAHFPVTLVYGVSLVNALDNLLTAHFHFAAINRAWLAFVVVACLFLILSNGREKVVGILSSLALPFALTIVAIAVVQIPQWDFANISDALKVTNNAPAGETIKNLWLTLPLITFAFCSTPLISPLAAHYRENGMGGEHKSVRVVRLAYALIFFSIIFFVLSCILSNPHETFMAAKAQNLNVLSVMEGRGGAGFLFYAAPLIAIIGMTKSFLGICLPVAETFSELTVEATGVRSVTGKGIAFVVMFLVSYAVVYSNPDVISLIETVCGPMIAIFLFLIPVFLIYTRKELRPLRGAMAWIVLFGGVLTVSALLYSMF
ncbi:TPA: AAA family ATPase [Enterobacter ludwigii]